VPDVQFWLLIAVRAAARRDHAREVEARANLARLGVGLTIEPRLAGWLGESAELPEVVA
jgi:hypothetical protein